MRSFFRALEREGVEAILISGQAAIVYGASTFSEDFDLWVRPSGENLLRLHRALALVGALVYKLTPPMSLAMARRGHGFHFTVPDDQGGIAYLDVMARPPRVGSFTAGRARCETIRTDWGELPVVGIEDLVRLKLTRRYSDYEVISNLAAIRLTREGEPRRRVARWALETTFRVDDAVAWARRWPTVRAAAATLSRPGLRALRPALIAGREPPPRALEAARRAVASEIAAHQEADVAYWRPIVDELRQLRSAGQLMPLGSPLPRE